jgi:hypothetical protein
MTGGAAWWDGLPGDRRYLGIGSATSMALAGVGAEVGIVARDRIRGETTIAELRALGGDGNIESAHMVGHRPEEFWASETRIESVDRVGFGA